MTSQQTRLRTEYRLQTTKAVQWSIRADTGVVTGDTQWNCAPMHTRTCSCQGNKLLAGQVRSSCSCFCQPTVYKIWHGDKQLPSNLLSSLIIGKLYFHHTVCSDALYSNSSTSEQIITNLAMRIMPLQTVTLVYRLLISYHHCYTHCNTTAKECQIPKYENERLSNGKFCGIPFPYLAAALKAIINHCSCMCKKNFDK